MRAFLALTLATTGAAARGNEIYRNVTSKRERCFEGSVTGRPQKRRLAFWNRKKPKKDKDARAGRKRDALEACGTILHVPARPPSLWCEAHRLRFPRKHGNTVLCVPQKNGNRDFSLLVYAMTYGQIPEEESRMNFELKHAGLSPTRGGLSMTTVTAKDTVYMISRNPFTRLLSLYLDKVLRCFGVGPKTGGKHSHCDHDLLDQSGAFPADLAGLERLPKHAPSFSQFLKAVERATERFDLCQVDHHLCGQSQGCLLDSARRLRLLRLEDMDRWFPCLNRTLGLSSYLEGDGWRRWTHKPCFYGSCGGAAGSNVGAVHPTGASGRVGEFYDAATAAIARRLYREDFEILGYPTALPL